MCEYDLGNLLFFLSVRTVIIWPAVRTITSNILWIRCWNR